MAATQEALAYFIPVNPMNLLALEAREVVPSATFLSESAAVQGINDGLLLYMRVSTLKLNMVKITSGSVDLVVKDCRPLCVEGIWKSHQVT